jgi:hypothetical protein
VPLATALRNTTSGRKLTLAPGGTSEAHHSKYHHDDDTSPVAVDRALLAASRLDIPLFPDTRTVQEPRRARSRWALGLGLLMAGAAIATFVLFLSKTEPTISAATASSAVTVPGPLPVAASAPQVVPSAARVNVRISVTPADAVLELDERRLTQNPYVATFEPDGREHELRVTAEHYRAERRVLRFDRDLAIELSLTPIRGRRERVAPAPRAPAPRAPAPRAPAPRAVDQPPSPPQIEPGTDLRARPREQSRRQLDEENPYAQ